MSSIKTNLPSIEAMPSKIHIDAGMQFLIDTHKKISSRRIEDYNGMFTVVGDDGNTHSELGGACHRSLNYRGVDGKRMLVATLSHPIQYCNLTSYDSHGPQTKYTEKDIGPIIDRWFDYVVNRSFAAPFVINKDESARELGVLFAADVPANVLCGGCMLTRHPREKMRYVAVWDYLVRVKGVSEDIAYMIAFGCNLPYAYLSGAEGALVRLNEQMIPHGSHTAFHFMSFKTIKNFLARDFDYLAPSYRRQSYYDGVSRMFGTVSSSEYNKHWQVALTKEYNDREKGVEKSVSPVVNPFAVSSTSRRQYMTWDTFLNKGGLELMLEMLK